MRRSHLLLSLLQGLQGLRGVLSLGQQGVFDDAGVAIQQGWSLCAEMLQNLKAFGADVLQVLVACAGLARRLLRAVRRSLCRGVGRGVGRRLWER